MRTLKHLITGAVVLVVTVAVWAGLTWVMGDTLHWRAAPLIAVGIIVVAGWVANGILIWRQSRQGEPPPA